MFTNRPLYNTAGFLIKVLRYFQEKQEVKLRLRRNKKYQFNFKGNSFFEHKLSNNICINLYKDSVLSKMIYDGFEQDELHFVAEILTKGDVFIDIGSNVGLFSLIASRCVGNEGKIIAIEPAPITYGRLLENVLINGITNIDSRNIGLSNELGELTFYISDNGFDAWNSFAPSVDSKLQKQIKVQTSTLEHELLNVDKENIKLIKIDVEGWEKFVLQGGEVFFKKYTPIVMVEFTDENTYNAGYSAHEIYDIMVQYGYEWYIYREGKLIKESKKLYYPYNNLIAIKS